MRALVTLVAIVCTSAAGHADERVATPHELAPTQIEIGGYAADFKLATWKQEAKAAGVSFETYVRGGLKAKFAAKAIPAIVDPSGQLRALDGHHKLTALRKIERDMGIVTPVKLDIVKDYSGYGFEAYASHLVDVLGKGYYGVRPPKSAAAKVRLLPSSFDGLGDNPLRSVLGVVFTKSGLEGSWFVDYVQFHLGERMLRDGLAKDLEASGLLGKSGKLTSAAAANPKLIAFFQQRIFSDPKLVAFLQRRIKPVNRSTAGLALHQAKKSFAATAALRSQLRSSARNAGRILSAKRRAPRQRARVRLTRRTAARR